MDEPCLILFDADQIKDYVFATGRLKEIRGASELVRQHTGAQFVTRVLGLGPWQEGLEGTIYASGAAGALLVAGRERAAECCYKLERAYRDATGDATLTAAWAPLLPLDDPLAAQAQARHAATQALKRRKASRPFAEEISGGGYLRYCASDRLRPASVRAPEPDTADGLLVSEATARKRLASFAYRQALEAGPFWQAFEQCLPEGQRELWRAAISASQDLERIGAQAEPPGYVALIYADGDGVGALIDEVVRRRGFAGYKFISELLDEAANTATAKALAVAYHGVPPDQRDVPSQLPASEEARLEPEVRRHVSGAEQTRFLPFEVITIGGDDVLLICTAERGLTVACELSRRMTGYVNEQLKTLGAQDLPAFSVSAGVVIAHDSLPIVQFERRGRDLLNSAKRARQPGVGGIDFHIVTTPGLDAIARVRGRDYQADNGRTRLTRRPLPLSEAELLLRHARHMRGLCDEHGVPAYKLESEQARRALPRLAESKIADLYDACRGGRIQSTLDVLAVYSRLPQRDRKALLNAMRDVKSMAYFPFDAPDAEGVYSTALPDLLEVMAYIAEEGAWDL